VRNLKIAWIWHSDNFGSQPEIKNETTPIMVNGVLYFTAGDRRSVVAADPGTGETLWFWRIDEGARTDNVRKNSRGVAYWSDGQQSRIFTVTPGYQLAALDARNGHPITAFGKDGVVDLTLEVEKDANFNPLVGHLMNTSPPLVFGNTIVIPTSLENARVPKSMKYPKGDIMAFDARTGKKVWVFHTIPRAGEFGAETWGNNSNVFTGHTGAWAPFSVDEELGILYLPVEGATGDQLAVSGRATICFSSSLVALDIKTESGSGISSSCTTISGTTTAFCSDPLPTLPSMAVESKLSCIEQAGIRLCLRSNERKSVWPLEERAVPQTDVPGKRLLPRNDFPQKPPAFDRQGMSAADVIDFTPQVKEMALKAIEGFRLGPCSHRHRWWMRLEDLRER
jgi:quinoprotein glucose dehydrogenase